MERSHQKKNVRIKDSKGETLSPSSSRDRKRRSKNKSNKAKVEEEKKESKLNSYVQLVKEDEEEEERKEVNKVKPEEEEERKELNKVKPEEDEEKGKEVSKSSRSESTSLCIFAYVGGCSYNLYRVDDLLSEVDESLPPLLVFGPGVLPANFCALVQSESHLYFVGEKETDVFFIQKQKLNNLNLNQKISIRDDLKELEAMNGPKEEPLVFVASNSLYVISSDADKKFHQFETYSAGKGWKDLKARGKGDGRLKSHVVVDCIAYFATTHNTVLSFNLKKESWGPKIYAPENPETFCDINPAFDAPVEIVGEMMLGAFKLPTDTNITVAASPYSSYHDSPKDKFMRPTLAPNKGFWTQFARRFDHFPDNESNSSHHMTTFKLEDDHILCFVSYGSNADPARNCALLTFYKILGGTPEETSESIEEEVLEGGDKFCYYSRQVKGEQAVKSYFNSEFMHRKLLKLETTKHLTAGISHLLNMKMMTERIERIRDELEHVQQQEEEGEKQDEVDDVSCYGDFFNLASTDSEAEKLVFDEI